MAQTSNPKPIEKLASALQECLNEAAELGASKAIKKIEPRFNSIDDRLDRQDETLRMVWKQCGGNSRTRLPIDEGKK